MRFNISKLFDKLLFLIPLGILSNLIFVYFQSDELDFSLIEFSVGYLGLAVILGIAPWLAMPCVS